MKRLQIFASVGVCAVLFSGCGIFDGWFGESTDSAQSPQTRQVPKRHQLNCQPQDLSERLASYTTQEKVWDFYYNKLFKDFNDSNKCDDWALAHYHRIAEQESALPTNIKDEEEFYYKKWQYCNAMPKWLESTLDGYIAQNKNNDRGYIAASEFKESWKMFSWLNGRLSYFLGVDDQRLLENKINCKAIKVALNAIESDRIELGNGKRAKCADLSFSDAPKCQEHFDNAYKRARKNLIEKQNRIYYEMQNKGK